MKMCTETMSAQKVPSDTTADVRQQADVMQNRSGAGPVPGGKQKTTGTETRLIETCKACRFRQDTTSNDKCYHPGNTN